MLSSFKRDDVKTLKIPRRRDRVFVFFVFAFSLSAFCLSLEPSTPNAQTARDEQLFQTSVPPMVLLVMGRDHKLYYEAYNDASDLDGDGTLDVGYKPSIDYYGYFDSYQTYTYKETLRRFEPAGATGPDKTVKVFGEWSGDFLNYLTMSRMDVLRKVLYGGYRSTDTATETVLERVYIPQDAHSWGKEYDPAKDTYDISKYAPLSSVLQTGRRHLFANTSHAANDGTPLLMVLTNSTSRIWDWVSSERPVAGPRALAKTYEVRVKVADSSKPESNCKQYPSKNYKPIGLLQQFGEPGKLEFGLLTGSFEKNLSGGVLRKAIGSITDEINASDGTFINSTNGIIRTINKLRITGFRYRIDPTTTSPSDYAYSPGFSGAWLLDRALLQSDQMKDWGNPIGEMMYEGLRYFAGTKKATDDFTYLATNSTYMDNILGLNVAGWDNPFEENACAKPFILVLSDINPSYDSDQLPGVYSGFGTGLGSLTSHDSNPVALNVENVAKTIGAAESIIGNRYIGQVSTMVDSSCKPKTMDAIDKHLGRIRGLCPEEPTKKGGYYSASVAHYGLIHDINPAAGVQNVITYVVALASPLPKIEINVGGKIISLVPFAKSVAGNLEGKTISPAVGDFQPTNTIVDFYIEELTPFEGRFRINFEDVEQGADHDMDAVVIYSYQVLNDAGTRPTNPADGTQVEITVQCEYASGVIIQHMGYIISGTTADGTYLEVLDKDVDGSVDPARDVDYFLDTPPGLYPGGNYLDKTPLPFSTSRKFRPSNTAAATPIKNPLWYAAKWGGFVDQNKNSIPDLQSEWDADGDGDPDNYFYVANPIKLEHQLSRTFSEIASRGVSLVAPAVSVDASNRTQSGDTIYMAFFKPLADNYWQGNLKKYGLDYVVRTDCGRTLPEWTLVDVKGRPATLCDGTFKPSSQSYWSTAADGASVDEGGAGERLKLRMPGDIRSKVPTSPYYEWRNIYTYINGANGALDRFLPTNANITNAILKVPDNLTRYRIFNFIHGFTYDATSESDSTPLAKRDWLLGDIIHSEPKIIDYLDDNGNLTYRFIAVGSNDGMLHVFTDSKVNFGGTTYQAGDEIFAFIPGDLLGNLQEFSKSESHVYMVDGSPVLYRSRTKSDGTNYDMMLVFGERSGGRSYWALDISKPNPAEWKVKWHIDGGDLTTGFEELGYTWSKPYFARLKTGDTTTKEVVIFAGGYDLIEDKFPENFSDLNMNGKRDTGEPYVETVGGTPDGYDKWNPGMDTMGRGIFVVDLANGTKLFKATYGDDDGDGTEAGDVTTGTEQKYAKMKYCFPADISLISLSDSLLLMYAADVYGQIWKIRYDYFGGSGKWTVRRIFTANPGSNLASGDASTFSANTQSLDVTDQGRKMFYPPDVSLAGNDWTNWPVLYFGTGDRQHPRYTMISNRMYFVSDTGTLGDETDLLNLTCGELEDDATVADDTKTALRNILLNGTNSVRGFYRVLDQMGTCPDVDLSEIQTRYPQFAGFEGQHILSQPTLFFKNVYFTSYQPIFDDPCNPAGNAFIYALDYSFGASVFDYFNDDKKDSTETSVKTLKDTFRFISGSSIPSGVRVIMRDGHAAGVISAGGGAAAGVGEEGSTTIPGPPGGISPLLWETE